MQMMRTCNTLKITKRKEIENHLLEISESPYLRLNVRSCNSTIPYSQKFSSALCRSEKTMILHARVTVVSCFHWLFPWIFIIIISLAEWCCVTPQSLAFYINSINDIPPCLRPFSIISLHQLMLLLPPIFPVIIIDLSSYYITQKSTHAFSDSCVEWCTFNNLFQAIIFNYSVCPEYLQRPLQKPHLHCSKLLFADIWRFGLLKKSAFNGEWTWAAELASWCTKCLAIIAPWGKCRYVRS